MSTTILSSGLGQIGMPEAVKAFQASSGAINILQAGIEPVEADPKVAHVGVGSAPNIIGELETDAAVMDGDTLNVGSVGALKGYVNSFWVARRVMEVLPHAIVVGDGAARFAAEQGAKKAPKQLKHIGKEHAAWLKKKIPADQRKKWPDIELTPYTWPNPDLKEEKDTVIYLVRTPSGQIVGGTSTSGWAYKYPGRLGDSPIIGAGMYADSRYGACACTHTGEMTIRANTAGSVVTFMKKGANVKEACHEAVEDLRQLRESYLGPVIIHAIDRNGEPYVVATSKEIRSNYWLWTSQSNQIESADAVVDEVPNQQSRLWSQPKKIDLT